MCGIAGIATRDGSEPSAALLDILQRALAHRGPDGVGRYSAPGLGLVQTRLAIIDLKTGEQPLYGSGNRVLVANGEIYNYLELRQELGEAHFKTHSDCEVPLFTVVRDGVDFAKSLRGMYAIALADQDILHLSRDPFGIKPLYYAETGEGILFASEIQALLATGLISRGIRPEAATEFVQLQFTTGHRTIFNGINRLAPGETLTAKAGTVAARRFKKALPEGLPVIRDQADALAHLDAALMDSVALHQRSDVPYGMFLSGGVDSSAVLVCMARLNQSPVRTFTARFPGTAVHDESEKAEIVAKALGANHITIDVTAKDFWTELPTVVAAMDDPVADYAALPSFLLAREAAKQVKVVLTGEGGDELFAGYGRYRSAIRPRWLGGRRMRRHGILDGLGVLREARHWQDGFAAAEQSVNAGNGTLLQKAQALDCADWLPNDLLTKLDRCLMAHGLEGRTPFLDSGIADLAFRLPDNLKIRHGQGKYLLRRWLEKALPIADPFAKKRGFTVPVAEWLMTKAADLAPLIATSAGIAEICIAEETARLFRDFAARGDKRIGAACWQLLFYALWHAIHVDRRPVRGDVFATLSGPF